MIDFIGGFMARAIPKETFSVAMEIGTDVKYIKGKEYEYKQIPDGFVIKGENGAAKLSVEDVERLSERKIDV